MSFLRSAPRTLDTRFVRHAQAIHISSRQFASGGYSGNTIDPKGKEPNKQDPNPSAHSEHLGPPLPKQGYNSSSNPTKGQKKSFSTFVSPKFNTGPVHFAGGDKESKPKSTKGLSPKILNEGPPPENASEDVKKHNEELEHRADRVHERMRTEDVEKERVDKEFWSGEFIQEAVIYTTVGAFVALLIEYW